MFGFLKKIRFYRHLAVAFWKKHRRIFFSAFLGGIILAVSLPPLARLWQKTRPPQKIGLIGKYTAATLPEEILGQISQGLVNLTADGSVVPALAENWEVENDGKLYRFHLKKGLFWHDGTPFSSAEINFNFSDVSVKKTDALTLEFELKEAFSPFPNALTSPLFKKGLLGVGETKVKTLKRNGQIVEEIILIGPDHSRRSFRFYPNETALRTAFKLGEINLVEEINDPGELRTWPGVKIQEKVKNDQLVALIFNTQIEPFAQKFFRQSLAYALKKDWSQRAFGPISPLSWAYNPNLKQYQYSLEKAQEMLKKAFEGNQPAEINLKITTFSSLFPVAEQIKTDWEALGIQTEIEVVGVIPENFQVLLVTENIPADPDQYLLWHSTQPGNLSRLKSPQIDRLLEEGRQTADPEKRKEIYADFQRFLVEDAPVVFLYHPTVYRLSRD